MKFSIPAFLKTAADIGTAQMQGQQEGQQAQLAQALQAAQAETARQNQQNALMGKLPLDESSQALFAQYAMNQPSPYAPIANLPGVSPAARAIYRGAPQPAVSPLTSPTVAGAPPTPAAGPMAGASGAPASPSPAGGAAAPASGRSFQVPGGPTLTLRGVNPKEAAAAVAQYQKLADDYSKIDLSNNPQADLAVKGWMRNFPHEIKTPEDMDAARSVISNLQQAQIGLGPQVQGQQDKELEKDTDRYTGRLKGLSTLNTLGQARELVNLRNMETDLKSRYKGRTSIAPNRFDDESDTIDEIDQHMQAANAAAKAGDTKTADQERATAQDLTKGVVGRVGSGITAADQSLRLSNFLKIIGTISRPTQAQIDQAAKSTGVDYLVGKGLPLGTATSEKALNSLIERMSSQNFAQLDPESQQALLDEAKGIAGYLKRKINFPDVVKSQMTPYQVATVNDRRDRTQLERKGLALRREEFDWKKTHPSAGAGARGQLTADQEASMYYHIWTDKTAKYNAFFKKGTDLYGQPDFDPTKKYADPYMTKAAAAYDDAAAAEQAYKNAIARGVKARDAAAAGTAQPAPGAAPSAPAGGPSTTIQLPPGVTPQQFRQRTYERLRGRGKSDAYINAFLRQNGGLP